ncbi:antitoxin VbhA family protein [Brevibacillus migulae]|uniref:antitoxin VbhA family protein n=1 Tax=Brevibacillus migulae TaxID=1644114 RepID=UPI00106E6916|nr:antitoxin VbhA family protein [Brevibacillus migulae]
MKAPRQITIEEAFESAKASTELEGFIVTEDDKALILACARGEITHEEFVQKSLEYAKQGK